MTFGDLLRDMGIEEGEANADEIWKAAARDAIHYVARRQYELTSEDVLDAIEIDITTHDARALGGLMRTAQAQGLITPTMSFRKATRASRHSAPIRVWRSEVYW